MAKIIFGKQTINFYSLYKFVYQLTETNLKCGFKSALDNICKSINSVRNMLSHQCSFVKLC